MNSKSPNTTSLRPWLAGPLARLLAVSAASIISAQTVMADAQDDFYHQFSQQRYFPRFETARTVGMAGSSVATASDSSSVTGNPAGLGFMQDAEISGTYRRDEVSGRDYPFYDDVSQDIDTGQVLFAAPIMPNLDDLPDWGNVGFGWTGYDSDVDDRLNTETDGTQLHFAYAKAINDSLSLGYSLQWVQDNVDSDVVEYEMDDGFAHTFGAQWWANEDLSFGATFFFGLGDPNADIGGVTPVSTDYDAESYGFEIGTGYTVGETLFTFSGDYVHYDLEGDFNRYGFGPNGNEDGYTFAFRFGIEQDILDWLKARAGYRYQGNQEYEIEATNGDIDNSAKYNALALGVGAHWDNFRIDYGVEMRFLDDTDVLHAVTASVPFSLCREDW
jgi:hypothetical protein